MYTLARWSKQLLSPSSTACDARLSSSSKTQFPSLMAVSKIPSRHSNAGPFAVEFSTGRSLPIKSEMSVCSERLIRTSLWPEAAASAETKLVLPTPGEPSRRIGFFNCMALNTRKTLRDVVGAVMSKVEPEVREVPTLMKYGKAPNFPSRVPKGSAMPCRFEAFPSGIRSRRRLSALSLRSAEASGASPAPNPRPSKCMRQAP
mmetsp:Transcript_31942/g.53420  ORF Transcript_31942/g.53420 Transcript_31942/m.53420 type:complete len:203 (-) Transcript_31942:182-790(-)